MGIRAFFEKLFGKGGNESPSGRGKKNGNRNGHDQGEEGKDGVNMVCVDCKKTYLFETGEQKFFKMRGLTPPKRCHNCRSRKRSRR